MDKPSCQEHPNGHVRRQGYYGADKQYQRWQCVPENGDRPHFVSRTMSRRRVGKQPGEDEEGRCPHCRRVWQPGEGMPSGRGDFFTLREKAQALRYCAMGESYRQAGQRIRIEALASEFRGRPPALSRSGRNTRDWVAQYVPIIAGHYLEDTWPEVVVLDELPFHVRDPSGRPSGRQYFVVLAAMSYDDGCLETFWKGRARTPRLWRLSAVKSADTDAWTRFLAQLDGEPIYVVSDRSPALVKAVRRLWSMAEVYPCTAHLAMNVEERLRTGRLRESKLGKMLDRSTFTHPVAYAGFRVELDRLADGTRGNLTQNQRNAVAALQRWARTNHETIVKGLHHWHRPVSTGGLERPLREVKNALYDRRKNFRNIPRLNCLLSLMALHQRREDDVLAWTELLRRYHQQSDGAPPPRRVVDSTSRRLH